MTSSMSRLLSKFIVMGLALTLIAPTLSGCAETSVLAADERCNAVLELPDGSWLVRRPLLFGRTVRVESGATLLKDEVLDGIDIGAVLERKCRDPSLNVIPTVVKFWLINARFWWGIIGKRSDRRVAPTADAHMIRAISADRRWLCGERRRRRGQYAAARVSDARHHRRAPEQGSGRPLQWVQSGLHLHLSGATWRLSGLDVPGGSHGWRARSWVESGRSNPRGVILA